MLGQMLHQTKKKRQIVFLYEFFIEGQDERIFIGANEIVGVLDTLGDAFVAMQFSHIILGQKAAQIFIGNLRIDSQIISPSGLLVQFFGQLEGDVFGGCCDGFYAYLVALFKAFDDFINKHFRSRRAR